MTEDKTVTLKLDASEAMQMVSKVLQPGAVLLTAETVQFLLDTYGVSTKDLEACGGILAAEDAQPSIDYRELLKKYMGYVYECIDTNEFDAIRFDVGTDDSLTEEQKVAIIEMMHEVENE